NRSGCGVFIADGSVENVIPQIFAGKNPGTFFVPSGAPLESKKRWLAFFQQPSGTVTIDAGARDALLNEGRSLLAKGITAVDGDFRVGEIINIAGPASDTIARGISQFSSSQIAQIQQKDISEIRALFPGRNRYEIVHRDSMVMLE
ncbi:MAG TPA: PUA domain-containing protein, partial [Opitutales bacterium]|nr:PUA domain-containing protein [Opitutales bacterium]